MYKERHVLLSLLADTAAIYSGVGIPYMVKSEMTSKLFYSGVCHMFCPCLQPSNTENV